MIRRKERILTPAGACAVCRTADPTPDHPCLADDEFTYVDRLPQCQRPGCTARAAYDTSTLPSSPFGGSWGNLCAIDRLTFGPRGLGTGVGQVLVPRDGRY